MNILNLDISYNRLSSLLFMILILEELMELQHEILVNKEVKCGGTTYLVGDY